MLIVKRMLFFVSIYFVLTGNVFAYHNESSNNTISALSALESSAHGRLGVYAINTGNDRVIQYHANQRFPLCSTAKLMVVTDILKHSETNPSLMQQRVKYSAHFVATSGYTPITKLHVKQGMTIKALCVAAMQYSDNAAMNLLMQQLGGPKKVTAFAHSIGNTQFRLDRWEPALNSAIPGDDRDTSTPAAMADTLERLLNRKVLAKQQQTQLFAWMKGNTTGGTRIRAGVPKGWVVADRTGAGEYGTNNDIAILWSPKAKPIILTIYFTQFKKQAKPDDQVIVKATRLILSDINIVQY